MIPFKCILSSFLLVQALFSTANATRLDCWTCEASSIEECRATRVAQKCDASAVCTNLTTNSLNTTSGEETTRMKLECTFASFCQYEKGVCDTQNGTIKPPMKMIECSFSCCTSGPDCVKSPDNTTNTTTTTPTTVPTTSAPTTKTQAAYTASLWVTDMSLCKTKCCGGTPAQIWQNRTCCAVRAGSCLGVALAREVKCEDTYCNQEHCGACQLHQLPLVIKIAFILSVLYQVLI
ncbi:uncharacterized protein LOC116287522 [Actinia tenebrosa]|uniref:Uncharacterized protein LOC116287522 n=1 Tax=Actinia tenebrosa TaxID=6105 RepID=A0A6P8HC33_ACTTE|nr:uncharacterized protein LOC116287522 [Actinia tenebrosa]